MNGGGKHVPILVFSERIERKWAISSAIQHLANNKILIRKLFKVYL